MSDRTAEVLALYEKHRFEDQLSFYQSRCELFDRATGQAAVVSAVLLGLSAAVSALAGASIGHLQLWTVLAAILPALAAAVASLSVLYAFDQQSKLYADAIRALVAIRREAPNLSRIPDDATRAAAVADYIDAVESVFRKEQAQWGQLTSSIQLAESKR